MFLKRKEEEGLSFQTNKKLQSAPFISFRMTLSRKTKSWRIAEASCSRRSEWTLSVVRRQSGKVDSYFIHPEIVAFGPKRSEYLASKYSLEQIKQSNSSEFSILTITEINDSVADVVPFMLDFMYSSPSDSSKGYSGAAAYELADSWGIPKFQEIAAADRKAFLTVKNIFPTIKFALKFGTVDNPLFEVATDWFAENLIGFPPSLAANLEPEILLLILRKNMQLPIASRIEFFSRGALVAHCIKKNNHCRLLTKDVLYRLTSEEFLPFVSPRFEAPEFLLAEARLSKGHGDTKLSNLQRRCIQSIATYWKDCLAGFGRNTNVRSFLEELSAPVLVELLIQTTGDCSNCKLEATSIIDRLLEAMDKKGILDRSLESTDSETVEDDEDESTDFSDEADVQIVAEEWEFTPMDYLEMLASEMITHQTEEEEENNFGLYEF